jgi:hypothetical protein
MAKLTPVDGNPFADIPVTRKPPPPGYVPLPPGYVLDRESKDKLLAGQRARIGMFDDLIAQHKSQSASPSAESAPKRTGMFDD